MDDYFKNQIEDNGKARENRKNFFWQSGLPPESQQFIEALIDNIYDSKEEIIKLQAEVERLNRDKEDTQRKKNRYY